MASWSDFASAAPSLAVSINKAIYQYGPGLAYLATVRPDGGPRVHPISPAIVDGGLYCVMLDTPKRRDLERDGRYAMHAFPAEDDDDEACMQGRALLVTDAAVRREVAAALRVVDGITWWLYELSVDSAMFAHRGEPAGGEPEVVAYQFWIDPDLTPALRRRSRVSR
jgi:Pyridoxamine 5'-phosphate oxidase